MNKDVSETQTAECRSSKPDVAGSIPVAYFFRNIELIGKPSVHFDFGLGILDFGLVATYTILAIFIYLSDRLNEIYQSFHQSKIQNPQSKISWGVSLIGKAAVLKTAAHKSLASSSPAPSASSIADLGLRIETNPKSKITNPKSPCRYNQVDKATVCKTV